MTSGLHLAAIRLSRTLRPQIETVWIVCLLWTLVARTVASVNEQKQPHGAVDYENNEFAEFEEDEEMDDRPLTRDSVDQENIKDTGQRAESVSEGKSFDEDEDEDAAQAVVEDETDEYSHLHDEDEFENYEDRVESQISKESTGNRHHPDTVQPLKFADVPAHLRSNWTNYQVELLVLASLAAYLLNYIYGKTKNQSLAYAWFEEHRELLEQQFSIVGDDGISTQGPARGQLLKETDSGFNIWCTGRAGCQGMLIQLKLLKRQDVIGILSQMVRPKYDRVVVRVELDSNEMDNFVMALGQRKVMLKLVKEVTDLSMFTLEKKNADKMGLPQSFSLFSEIAEATASIIDPRMVNAVNKYENAIEYIHFSDQYSGVKPQEGETQSRLPDTARVLIFSFQIPGKLGASEKDVEATKALMALVFYSIDKVRRYRLSKEGKQKVEKNRQTAQETFLKTTHQQRQEAAQARREEKTRERKQRLMDEHDPDKQRRLEKQEQKRESKTKQPRMKQLKVKQ